MTYVPNMTDDEEEQEKTPEEYAHEAQERRMGTL
jgi:hypothetical protein